MSKLSERHPTDFWGRDARAMTRLDKGIAEAKRKQQAAEENARRIAEALASASHHPEKGRRVIRCQACEEPGFVGSTCGCGWQL